MNATDTPPAGDDEAPSRPALFAASENGRLHDFSHVNRAPAPEKTRFCSPRVQSLHTWWWRFAGAVPQWQHFDILEHRGIINHLFMVAVLSPVRFQFRICGEASAAIVGRDNTHVVLECGQGGQFGPLACHYAEVVKARQPRKCHGSFHYLDQGLVDFESIDCPLSDAQGRITHLIGCLDICGTP